MIFYFVMVNAWSLAASILDGTFEEDYPIMTDTRVTPLESDEYDPIENKSWIYESPDGGKTVTRRLPFSNHREVIQGDYFEEIPWSNVKKKDDDLDWIEKSGGFEWTPGSPWPPEVPDEVEHSDAWYDYTRNDPDRENPFTDPIDRARADFVVGGGNTANPYSDAFDHYMGDYMADVDDQRAHHFGNNTVSPYITKTFKYEEDVILKQAEEYIAKTYELHYTGDEGKMQTLDLIESIGDAEAFCRSNAIKYLSRFGKKDGKNEKDILKAIHYCTLLHHFAFINDDSN